MTEEKPRLALIILAVEALPRAVAFYREAFGWGQPVAAPSYAEFLLPGALRLGLYARAGFAVNTGQLPIAAAQGQLTAAELYFYPPQLEPAIARLQQLGARMLSPLTAREWGDEAAYFADPDGNVLVLARPLAAPSV